MCLPSIVLYFAFLLVASFSEPQDDFTNGNEQSDNSTVQSDPLVNSTKYRNEEIRLTRFNSQKNSIKNNDKMQHESCINSTNNNCKNDSVRYESRDHIIKNVEDNNQTSMKFYANSTEINDFTLQEINKNLTKTEDKNDSISYKLNSNRIIETTFVEYRACNDNITCIQFCCPFGNILTMKGRCVSRREDNNALPSMYALPNMYALLNLNEHENDSEDETVDELFLTIRDPCVAKGYDHEFFFPNTYLFLTNGSLYNNHDGEHISPKSYCFAIMFRDTYDVIVCDDRTTLPVFVSLCLLLSLPFLLLTFIIYSILPEFQNIHGYTLRAHVGSLFITYVIMCFGQVFGFGEVKYCVALEKLYSEAFNLIKFTFLFTLQYCRNADKKNITNTIDIVITINNCHSNICSIINTLFNFIFSAYIFYFFFLSSFFWLNVICFDIWWTFRNLLPLRPYRTKIKSKKKLIIYSIYAWGVTIIINVICAIMDYIPLPENLVRPEMCEKRFWFGENEAKTLYFYVPIGVTIISNIYFFIRTTLTILYQKIQIANLLRDYEIIRHDENKQRFNMYLKLFVVMGITWVLEIMSWVDFGADIVPQFIWYPADIVNALQGLTIFIIFVCRKKTLQTLLKRFDWKSCDPFKIRTRNIVSNTTSTRRSRTIPMQRIIRSI
ncbi:G-protein coupled receptor Mth2 [Trachymyrmex cornetzi]|uniref:G-protein coupled receptor Mth2 n=1 Tax=Trachymyrmex cornetzi TaxID=471704 RepID=A0A195EF46_9HYME|nr:G-protein coupled receptor Mth2 [Trachymyrmex cornetzi]